MQSVPAPCTNCLRFHYGTCYDAPKQCHKCGGFNHIERYCPYGRRLMVNKGEPLPGTRTWCEMWGLDHDPELRHKVLTAIKTSPGCAIWVNNECIYGANAKYFQTDDPPRGREQPRGRGRPLGEGIARKRSRSPTRERVSNVPNWRQRQRQRSRSPLRRYSPPLHGRRGSPIHRRSCAPSPSRDRARGRYEIPEGRPCSPRHAT
jgi:hypothetical protein